MAEKDDRENLGDDLGLPQRQFLLELSSVLRDKVPSPEIAFAQMTQSNEAISDVILSFLLLTESAPPETPGGGDKEVSGTSKVDYVHHVPA